MRLLAWEIVFIAGIAGGAATCAGLVAPRRYLPWLAFAGSIAGAALGAGVVGVWNTAITPETAVIAAFVGLGAAIGGYALGAAVLPVVTRLHPRPVAIDGAPDDGTVHLVLLADVEPEDYRPGDLTRTLDLYESVDVPLPPYLTRPLVYASEQARYRRVGRSPARDAVRKVASALGARPDGETPRGVSVAFCSGGATLAETVASLVGLGGRRIIVVALTVAWTREFDHAVADACDLDLRGRGVELVVTEPLWASQGLAAAAARRALTAFGENGLEDGVVLVSEGNPWQWDREYPVAAEQSTFFAQRVRSELVEAGLPTDRIRQAWLEWEQPDIPEAVRHLAALGAAQIALVPVDFLVTTLSAAVDLPLAGERATFETGIRIEVVPPLEDEPALISALRGEIARAATTLEVLDDTCGGPSSPGTARG